MTALALEIVTATERGTTMQAIVRDRYGSPEVLKLEEVAKPELVDDGVLVRVHASSVNRADYYHILGKAIMRPMMGGILKPKTRETGTDFAGTVEAVGKDVAGFNPGDEVFGGRSGAFAEYVCVRNGVALKPANMTFEEAAAVPVAGLTALQGLRDHGKVTAGQRVLINGASGGVGTYAVQIAKAFGADITAVCSARNVEPVRALGADRVIDYTKQDFAKTDERYDVIFDVAGNRSWSTCKRLLKPKGILLVVGAPATTPVLGPLGHIGATWLASRFSRKRAVFYVAKFNRPDMEALAKLLEDGKMKSVVERTYALHDVRDALRYLGDGHAQGKIVITI